MKQFILIILSAIVVLNGYAQNLTEFTAKSNQFFSTVVSNGKVDYASIKQSPDKLNGLIKQLSNQKLESASADQKKAFYINSYNLLVINQVVTNYPLISVLDVPGFFDKNKFLIANEKLTLNEIENNKLRKEYNDPRFHFVLVCGANGCPPIISEAYTPEKLNSQLNKQTKLAVNNPNFIKVESANKKVLLSEIFKWYEGDFTQNQTAIEFINKYRTSKIPNEYKSSYYPYDWNLNFGVKKKLKNSPELNSEKALKNGSLPKENNQSIAENTNSNLPGNKSEKTSEVETNKITNLQEYTPSVLLDKGKWEFKSFQNLYTQTGGFNENQKFTDYGSRSTFFTSINQFTYGINKRFNVGLDLWVKSVLYHEKEDSPFQLFQFKSNPKSRTEISTIGPRIRINPFKKLSHFAINTSFLIPVANDQNASSNPQEAWLANDGYLWITQIYYDQTFGDKFQMFFQLAPWYTIQKKGEAGPNKFELPLDIFASYFATKRLSFYVQQGFWTTFNIEGDVASYFLQGGAGTKYQVIPGWLEFELSYTNFYYGMNSGAGQTFNFGIRILRI
ncbi:MAG: DUF547 domain-containing protein [Salibacteraceae bacterium]